jgi:hypothetical protein
VTNVTLMKYLRNTPSPKGASPDITIHRGSLEL